MAKTDYTKYAAFTRAELIRTIEVLAERERNLLNALARAGVMPWDRGPNLLGRGPGDRHETRNPRPC